MSEYVIRDGVLLTSILDQHLLVSTEACREKCAYVKMINSSAAFYWKMIERGCTINEMVEAAIKEFNIDDSVELKKDILEYIELLKAAGYLLSDEELKEL